MAINHNDLERIVAWQKAWIGRDLSPEMADAVAAVSLLTDQQREELCGEICRGCGRLNLPIDGTCHCTNDE